MRRRPRDGGGLVSGRLDRVDAETGFRHHGADFLRGETPRPARTSLRITEFDEDRRAFRPDRSSDHVQIDGSVMIGEHVKHTGVEDGPERFRRFESTKISDST